MFESTEFKIALIEEISKAIRSVEPDETKGTMIDWEDKTITDGLFQIAGAIDRLVDYLEHHQHKEDV